MDIPSKAWISDHSTVVCPVCAVVIGNGEGSKETHRRWHKLLERMFKHAGVIVETEEVGPKETPNLVYWENQAVTLTQEEYAELVQLAQDDPVAANEKARQHFLAQHPEVPIEDTVPDKPPEMPPGDDPRSGHEIIVTPKRRRWRRNR